MSKTQNQKKLLKILNEIFQLDQSDLDFGIYRIMNTKSKEIQEFLDKDLLSSVASAFSSNDNSAVQKELDELITTLTNAGMNADDSPKVQELKDSLSSTTSSNNLENEVFSHLANFFKRYYKDGDFVSLRRYKDGTYVIPYEGEEVKLHWANSDQYYIKSGEYFRDYTFRVDDKTIHLKLSDAETESNNNKATSDKERRFIYIGCDVLASPDELNINFEYKAVGKGFKQDKLNEEAISKVLEDLTDEEFITALNTLAPTEKNKKRTIFEKHLKSYTSRNSFDYFIHKDLGRFLGRELDFYIKNEMLFLDDIMISTIKYEEVKNKINIFKEISEKIIKFLTQFEELQKKLWEKKKFIIETNYCITLDKIDEDYYEEIFACKEQLEEWKELFDVDVQSVENLKEEKYLVLDTEFFDIKFKYKLLSEFDNLDEDIDGVLINSENFGALNLLQDRYKEQIDLGYIDPPFNTGSDEAFDYKDNYQNSSWFSLMEDRIMLGKNLLSNIGSFYLHLDENANYFGRLLMNNIFKDNFLNEFIWCYRGMAIAKNNFTRRHDTVLIYKNKENNIFNWEDIAEPLSDTTVKKYKHKDENGRKYRLHGKNLKDSPIKNNTDIDLKWLETNPELCRIDYLDDKAGVKPRDWVQMDYINVMSNEKIGFATQKPEELISKFIKASSNKKSIVIDFFAGSGTTAITAHKLNRQWITVEAGLHFNNVILPRFKKLLMGIESGGIKNEKQGGFFKYFKLESYEDTLNNIEFTKTEAQQKAFDFHPEAKEDYILNYSLDVESQGSLLNIDTFSTPFDYKLKIATSSVGATKDTNIDLVETFNYLLGLVVKRMEMIKDYIVIEGQNLKNEKILIIWRDGQSSDELNEFFKKMNWKHNDREFDTIYVNGDNNLDNLRLDEDHFKVKLIEQEFKKLMFGE